MQVIRSVAGMRAALMARAPDRVGLVPTMGAFHDGHVALFRAARHSCDIVVVSLFVNPSQFNDAADLAAYPRDEARDEALAEAAGVDVLFVPSVTEMYGGDHATWVVPDGAAFGLEGEYRPGHFRGVATVCLKLFLIVRPDVAYFGQKDAQQAAVVQQLVRDLNVPLLVDIRPTVRDPHGLALSSRNARLSPDERQRALAIPRALHAGRTAHAAGNDPIAAARAQLAGIDTDYVAVADFNGHPTLAVAVRVGKTRLIDNVRLDD